MQVTLRHSLHPPPTFPAGYVTEQGVGVSRMFSLDCVPI